MQDLGRVPPWLGRKERAPRHLDAPTFDVVMDGSTTGQERRVQPGAQSAPVIGTAAQHRDLGSGPACELGHRGDRSRRLHQARARQHDGVRTGLGQRRAEVPELGPRLGLLDHSGQVGLLPWQRRVPLAHIPQARPSRMHDEDLRSPYGGLADP